jgi:CcmD family protein
MSDWPWVIASYALTWTVLGIYALWTVRNLRQARSELEAETRRAGGPPEVEP